jgi:Na+-translocating ferredoxin:NAD+ oxidoreductase RNF subunit RnfB
MSGQKIPEIRRRKFLGGVGTAAVGTAALATPGANLQAAEAKPPRWAMVMDLRRCIGCRACTVACKAENDVSLGRFRAVIQEVTTGSTSNNGLKSFDVAFLGRCPSICLITAGSSILRSDVSAMTCMDVHERPL